MRPRWVCSRAGHGKRVDYVSDIKGHGGVDWEYTTVRSRAKPLTVGWVRRFKAEMRYIGARGVTCVPHS